MKYDVLNILDNIYFSRAKAVEARRRYEQRIEAATYGDLISQINYEKYNHTVLALEELMENIALEARESEDRELFFRTVGNAYYLDYVFVEYTTPLFFLCSDQNGTLYCVQQMGVDHKYDYLLVEVSLQRIIELVGRRITLRDLYLKAENKQVLGILPQNILNDVEIIHADDLPDKYLPSDEYLDLYEEKELKHE